MSIRIRKPGSSEPEAAASTITRKLVKIPAVQTQRIKEKSDSLYQQILHSLYDGVMLTDSMGRVLDTNVRIEQMLDFSHDYLVGSGVTEYICNADDKLLEKIRKSGNERRSVILQAHCMRKDTSKFPAEIAISRLNTSNEERLCFLFRDITARKTKERELALAQAEKHEAELIRERMTTLSTLSHELNNPLQLMMSLSERAGHSEYHEPLNRIVSVLRELQKEDAFEQIIDDEGNERYALNIKKPQEPCMTNKIMIAEDEASMINLFKEIISRLIPDAQIELAANGLECLDAFSKGHHKIIILDVNMPVMGGQEASQKIEALCEEKNWQKPHFIFSTGFVPPESIIRMVGDGSYNSLLAKPFHMGELVSVIMRYLSI